MYIIAMKECKRRSAIILLFYVLLMGSGLQAQPYRTARPGESVKASFFNQEFEVPAYNRSDRKSFTIGSVFGGPDLTSFFSPMVFFTYDKHSLNNKRQLYLKAGGIYNIFEFTDSSWNAHDLAYMLTWENNTPFYPQRFIVNGQGLKESEIYYGYLRLGLGLGLRELLSKNIDNDVRFGFYYEPGYHYFKTTENASEDYQLPPGTVEHRFHFKFNMDYLERNFFELRHFGWAMGGDLVIGSRNKWADHGYYDLDLEKETREYFYMTAYLTGALTPPELNEKHKFLPAFYFGYSPHKLDRYSAICIGGGPALEDARSLSIPVIHGTMPQEFLCCKYFISTYEYRYEVFPYLYYHMRYTFAILQYLTLASHEPDGIDDYRVQYLYDDLHTFSTAVSSLFLWNSRLVFEIAYSPDIRRAYQYGGGTVLLHITKQF